jgi:LmbE family N-acetylglucosaminyl deacetylase
MSAQPLDQPPLPPGRALAVFAHPDDVDFGAGGTVARWTDEGWDVRYVVVTRPHRLLTLDPQPLPTDRFVNHPDHRAVGQCALDVTMTGGTTASIFPELLDEGLPPWRELVETWLMGPAAHPVAIDISATMDRKLAALRCHRSQIGPGDDAVAALEKRVRQRAADAGAPHGLAQAETFRVLSYRR